MRQSQTLSTNTPYFITHKRPVIRDRQPKRLSVYVIITPTHTVNNQPICILPQHCRLPNSLDPIIFSRQRTHSRMQKQPCYVTWTATCLTILSLLWLPASQSFVGRCAIHHGWMVATEDQISSTRTSSSSRAALTERQMQFWEDVNTGLNDIENFYAKKGQNIDRIRRFAKTASGELEAPKGYAPGHEPSEEHVDGLTAKPFWDVSEEPANFPWAKKLEEKYTIIQKEFEARLERDKELFSADSAWQNQVMGSGWSAIRLQRLGVWNMDNCKEFPKTYELLRSLRIPLAVRGVCFARQAPGSGVAEHSDGRNFILTSHLGLKIPSDCWIEVGGERKGWTEGKLTTLDTSFVHSTGNPTDEERHVLILDFWHPELTEAERAALEFVYDLRNKFESGKIPFRQPKALQEGEGLGGWWKSVTGGGE